MKTEIKAQDLRIGNWVIHIETGLPTVILDIYSDDNGIYQGIPLTPEILEKAGFEEDIERGYWQIEIANNWKISYAFCEDEKGEFIAPEIHNGTKGCMRTKCIYLHQLQNLYHSLTGTELKIEL